MSVTATKRNDRLLLLEIRDNFNTFEPPLDLSQDGNIDDTDKELFRQAADLNVDGAVNGQDTAYFLNELLGSAPGPAAIDLLEQYEDIRDPDQYIQDRLYSLRGYGSQDQADQFWVEPEVAELRSRNIITLISSNNNGYTNALPNPACTPSKWTRSLRSRGSSAAMLMP